MISEKNEVAEIRVLSDQDAVFAVCKVQYFVIGDTWAKLARIENVNARRNQRAQQGAVDGMVRAIAHLFSGNDKSLCRQHRVRGVI